MNRAIVLEADKIFDLQQKINAVLSELEETQCYNVESVTTAVAVCSTSRIIIKSFVATIFYSEKNFNHVHS